MKVTLFSGSDIVTMDAATAGAEAVVVEGDRIIALGSTAEMRVDNIASDDDRLWTAGVKMHADGSPFIGNIWLSEPCLESDVTIERM
ncbi:MAG: putative amidohydrolase YtcJ [Planctomycetota bacterium]|jgi:predicted amidohydrolase YtcJ